MTDLIDTGNLPDDLAALARAWVPLLGLSDYHLRLKLTDAPGGDLGISGAARPNTRYLSAEIDIARDLTTTEAQRTLLHELLHVVLGPTALVAKRIAALGGVDDDHARELYADAEEPIIERLCRTLLPALLAAAGVAAEA